MEVVTKLKVNHNSDMKKRVAEYLEMVFKNSKDEFLNNQVLNRFMWTITENNNDEKFVKYEGQPYWSKRAIKQFQENKRSKRVKKDKGLRHDHTVPKKKIQEFINELEDKTATNILEIFNKYAHAVVIHKEEDVELNKKGVGQKMPKDFKWLDGNILDRYNSTSIEVLDVSGKDLMDIKL